MPLGASRCRLHGARRCRPADNPDPVGLRLVAVGLDNGGETRYRLTLRLTNPGEKSLRISGISCHLHIDGVLAVQGFAGALAPLPPQGSTRLIMEARANLLGGLKLMTGLSGPAPRPYRLDLQLRRPWTLRPLAVSTNGEILLDD